MIKRRQFIQQAAFMAAGLALFRPSILGAAPSVKPSRTGIQLYTLRSLLKPGTVQEVLEKVAAAGYKEVETYGFNPKGGFWGLSPEEFKRVLSANGLTSPSGHYGADAFFTKNGTKDDIMPLIEGAAAANQAWFTIPWLAPGLRNSADDYKAIVEKLDQAARLCKEAGLKLAYHNHDFEFEDHGGTTGMDIILNQTDAEDVKVELDIYWAVFAGKDPVKMIKQHPGRFTMWHVKDMSKTNRKENTEVGNGSIDYKSLFAHADKAGLKHYFVEQENNYTPDPYGSIASSAAFIKKAVL
ncbi:MAG TPA: sugar phosphate isomerase/epimerase [Sphingobacteriaceae bacterium]